MPFLFCNAVSGQGKLIVKNLSLMSVASVVLPAFSSILIRKQCLVSVKAGMPQVYMGGKGIGFSDSICFHEPPSQYESLTDVGVFFVA